MSSAPRRFRLTTLALAGALVLSACGDTFRPPAAVVNGVRISDDDLAAELPLFRFIGSVQMTGCGQPESGERPGAACARVALLNLIQQELVRPFAERNHIRVTDDEVDATLRSLEQQIGSRIDDLLAAQSLTRADLRSFVDRFLLVRHVAQLIARREGPDSVTDWFRERLRDANIEINPRYGRLDLQLGRIVAIRSTATEVETEAPAPTGSP